MKVDLADKESLESKRAQHEEEAREKCKLLSEQKAVRPIFIRININNTMCGRLLSLCQAHQFCSSRETVLKDKKIKQGAAGKVN